MTTSALAQQLAGASGSVAGTNAGGHERELMNQTMAGIAAADHYGIHGRRRLVVQYCFTTSGSDFDTC